MWRCTTWTNCTEMHESCRDAPVLAALAVEGATHAHSTGRQPDRWRGVQTLASELVTGWKRNVEAGVPDFEPADLVGSFATSWSGREDLNLRLHGPEPCALPGCATPRDAVLLDVSREKRGGAAWSPGGRKSRHHMDLTRRISETSAGTAVNRSSTSP